MGMSIEGPSPLAVGASLLRARLETRPPRPSVEGRTAVDHGALAHALERLRDGGQQELAGLAGPIDGYLLGMSKVDPDQLNRAEALAFWLNVYNAGALRLAERAAASGARPS